MRVSVQVSAALAVCVLAGMGAAQAQSTSSIGRTPEQIDQRCQQAVTRLAETRGRDREAEAIALSSECENLRRSRMFDVRDDMAEISQMLRDEGVDFERFLGPKLAECRKSSQAQALETDPGERGFVSSSEFYERCEANARVSAYSEGIVELQRVRRERFIIESQEVAAEAQRREQEHADALAAHQAAIDQNRRNHEANMADWRRRVELCESGNTAYCASE